MTRDLPLETVEIETPMARMRSAKIASKKLVFAPLLPIWTAAIDEGLDAHGFIVPGLGDAATALTGRSDWRRHPGTAASSGDRSSP